MPIRLVCSWPQEIAALWLYFLHKFHNYIVMQYLLCFNVAYYVAFILAAGKT